VASWLTVEWSNGYLYQIWLKGLICRGVPLAWRVFVKCNLNAHCHLNQLAKRQNITSRRERLLTFSIRRVSLMRLTVTGQTTRKGISRIFLDRTCQCCCSSIRILWENYFSYCLSKDTSTGAYWKNKQHLSSCKTPESWNFSVISMDLQQALAIADISLHLVLELEHLGS